MTAEPSSESNQLGSTRPHAASTIAIAMSSLAAVTEFTNLIHLPPFFADLAAAAILLTAAVSAYVAARATKTPSKEPQTFGIARTTILLPAFILLATAIYLLSFPASNALRGDWAACGSVIENACAESACIKLLDFKMRPAVEECMPLDSSDFFASSKQRFWYYRPEYAALSCGNTDGRRMTIPKSLLDNPSCDGDIRP